MFAQPHQAQTPRPTLHKPAASGSLTLSALAELSSDPVSGRVRNSRPLP